MNVSFEDRVYIITGGASGVGRATAELLAEAGAYVVIADRDDEAGRRVVAEIGSRATFHAIDLRELGTFAALVAQTLAARERIDGLANVAAVYQPVSSPFLDMTPERWQLADDINHRAVFFLSQAVARAMIDRGSPGAIVNVASGAAFRPVVNQSAYSGTKGGVVALTRVMAHELAAHGIRVNVVAPGHTASETVRGAMSQERLDAAAATLVGGRWMEPREVGQVMRFMLGDLSRGMSGATVNVNLGNYMPH